jgi:hypothetical protein
MGTRTVVSQQRHVMEWVGEQSTERSSRASALLRAVPGEPRLGYPPRVEQALVSAGFEGEPSAEPAPPGPAVLVVEGENHLAPTVFTPNPPLIALQFQFSAATNCRSGDSRSWQVHGRSE